MASFQRVMGFDSCDASSIGCTWRSRAWRARSKYGDEPSGFSFIASTALRGTSARRVVVCWPDDRRRAKRHAFAGRRVETRAPRVTGRGTREVTSSRSGHDAASRFERRRCLEGQHEERRRKSPQRADKGSTKVPQTRATARLDEERVRRHDRRVRQRDRRLGLTELAAVAAGGGLVDREPVERTVRVARLAKRQTQHNTGPLRVVWLTLEVRSSAPRETNEAVASTRRARQKSAGAASVAAATHTPRVTVSYCCASEQGGGKGSAPCRRARGRAPGGRGRRT